MEERPSIRKVAAIILNKQSRRADKGWTYGLGFGRVANNSSPQKLALLRKGYICPGPGLILWYYLSNGKGTCDLVHSCQQKSIGLKFSKSQTGSDVRYSCHHNSSRFTFPHLRIRAVSLPSIHYNQSHRVYINRRRQYICLI